MEPHAQVPPGEPSRPPRGRSRLRPGGPRPLPGRRLRCLSPAGQIHLRPPLQHPGRRAPPRGRLVLQRPPPGLPPPLRRPDPRRLSFPHPDRRPAGVDPPGPAAASSRERVTGGPPKPFAHRMARSASGGPDDASGPTRAPHLLALLPEARRPARHRRRGRGLRPARPPPRPSRREGLPPTPPASPSRHPTSPPPPG